MEPLRQQLTSTDSPIWFRVHNDGRRRVGTTTPTTH
ncbi:hypothetical protein AVEN_121694-1, partial [Araneus ventricosus]